MIDLYDFQAEDVEKLAPMPGRLNASEMGSGKTYVGGKLVGDIGGRQLWVGPLGTLAGSRDKLIDMGIDMPMTIIDPKNRNRSWNTFIQGQKGIYFCHWDALRLLVPELSGTTWDHVIADEIHKAQNRKAQQTKALKKLKKTGAKTGMSGTPVTGSNDKYWSVLNWLYPKDYTSYWKFFERYVDYEVGYTDTTQYKIILGPLNEAELLARVEPYYVRHLKKEQCCPHHPEGVMPWLPDKYYDPPGGYHVALKPEQRRAYNQMREDMLAWVGEQEDKPIAASVVVAQLTRLQQFAVAYAEVNSWRDAEGKLHQDVKLSEPSSKLDLLMDLIENNPGKAFVVWSQFKQLIYLLQARCRKKGIGILLYTGDNVKTRDANVKAFANGDAQVFAGTISAGGVGVDGLQHASSTVVFLDRLWNPALNKQAEDRLHRDGQENAVQVIDIMADDTVDLGRAQRLELKWSWIRAVLGDGRYASEILAETA